MRILWYLVRRFLLGVLAFFAPLAALALGAIIAVPILVSFLGGAWFLILCGFWFYKPEAWIKQALLFSGTASVVSFAIGAMMVWALVDLTFWLLRPRRPVEPSLEMSLANDGRLID